MTPSKACADFIKGFEKCRLKAYMPTPNDRPTIGWGSTGPDIHMGMTWTQAQADSRFAHDLAWRSALLNAALGSASTTQHQYDAMFSLAYNIGIANFKGSTVLAKHVAGQYEPAARAFAAWNKQRTPKGLMVLAGLTRRRAAEAAMYEAA